MRCFALALSCPVGPGSLVVLLCSPVLDPPAHGRAPLSFAGRTGRCGKTGVATTFINKAVDEHLLLDLKHLLVEAKQRVPPVLLALEDPADLHAGDGELGAGCSYCFAEDHQILTESGFVWLDEAIASAQGRAAPLRYAAFDAETGALLYEPATRLIVNPASSQTMVEMTHHNE
jgi:hypothetical protein